MNLGILAYELLGTTIAGLAPILLPLAVSQTGSISHIGFVMAAFNLGGLRAPDHETKAE